MTDNSWTDTERFDSKAAQWDANAIRASLADAVSRALIAHMPVMRPLNALEFGCGTGLLTTRIAPCCTAVTAVDTSQEMLKVLDAKIASSVIPNVRTAKLDLSHPGASEELPAPFDYICSSMTLHHIPDTLPFLSMLNTLCTPGGMLAIADLDREDGLFHDDATEKVHHGFDRRALQEMLETAGFSMVSFMTAHIIEKPNRAGRYASYPVFLFTALKPQL